LSRGKGEVVSEAITTFAGVPVLEVLPTPMYFSPKHRKSWPKP